MLTLLFSASKAHATSDDAFEVDFQQFVEKHLSLTFDPKQTKSIEFLDFSGLYNAVTAQLSFLKIILLTETNSTESTRIIANRFNTLPTLLLSLIGLRNERVSTLSCHVFRLLLGRLDTLLPEGTSEVNTKMAITLTLVINVLTYHLSSGDLGGHSNPPRSSFTYGLCLQHLVTLGIPK